MPEPCPKCAYVRQATDPGATGECPRCGVIYEKYLAHQARAAAGAQIEGIDRPFEPALPLRERLWTALWQVPEREDTLTLYGSAIVLAGSVAWGLWFILQPWNTPAVGGSFLHQVDLPFHEFGHVLFRPFGEWLMFLGGSLFQCLLPLLLAGYFLFKQRQPFSASICLWWCGQNFIDVAPYIGDARDLALQLVGEATEDIASIRAFRHDWHNILAPLGWLPYDHLLAGIAKITGATLMLLSWAWGGLLLRMQQLRLA